jgi:hypothetical protein
MAAQVIPMFNLTFRTLRLIRNRISGQIVAQFLISTLCVGDKVPIHGKNEDGKASDKEINNTLLSEISQHMARFGVDEKAFIYMADSALVSPGNMERRARDNCSSHDCLQRIPSVDG